MPRLPADARSAAPAKVLRPSRPRAAREPGPVLSDGLMRTYLRGGVHGFDIAVGQARPDCFLLAARPHGRAAEAIALVIERRPRGESRRPQPRACRPFAGGHASGRSAACRGRGPGRDAADEITPELVLRCWCARAGWGGFEVKRGRGARQPVINGPRAVARCGLPAEHFAA